jgi:hypothetical protein
MNVRSCIPASRRAGRLLAECAIASLAVLTGWRAATLLPASQSRVTPIRVGIRLSLPRNLLKNPA